MSKHIIRCIGVTELGGGPSWGVYARVLVDDGYLQRERVAVPVTQESRDLALAVALDLAAVAGVVFVEAEGVEVKVPGSESPAVGVTYAPCREEEGSVERCAPDQAQFWSVYWLWESGRAGHRLSRHLADVEGRREAEALAKWLAEVLDAEAVADSYADEESA